MRNCCWWSKIWLLGRLDWRQRRGSFVGPNLSVGRQDRRLSRDKRFWCDFWSRRSGCVMWDVVRHREGWTLSSCGFHCLRTSSSRLPVCTEYTTHEAGRQRFFNPKFNCVPMKRRWMSRNSVTAHSEELGSYWDQTKQRRTVILNELKVTTDEQRQLSTMSEKEQLKMTRSRCAYRVCWSLRN